MLSEGRFRQVPATTWPQSETRPIATLALDPAEISSQTGLEFEMSADDLGELDLAVFALADRKYGLVRYRQGPQHTMLFAAEDDYAAPDAVVAELGLDPDVIQWRAS